MLNAITRPTGPELADCELTHIERVPIDVVRAIAQHDAYLLALRRLGVEIIELPRLASHPDAVFVEDVGLVLPEVAIVLRPGADSRLGEMPSMAAALSPFRECLTMGAPATLDGGDVIVFGRRVLVGSTSRTNASGVEWLTRALESFGYRVEPVPVAGVLHLKSAATVVDEETLVVNPEAVDLSFLGAKLIEVPPAEPHGANVVAVGDHLLVDGTAPQTMTLLAEHGADLVPLELDEFTKAEGAISCKAVIFDA